MQLKPVDLTTALRPSLLPEETLLFVQDAVGLYEGKFKIPSYQNGHAYLTSHRACYVDDEEPRRFSVAIELKDVDRVEYQPRFLRASPKITFVPKSAKKRPAFGDVGGTSHASPSATPSIQPSTPARTESPSKAQPQTTARLAAATWICPICSFSNPVPSNFDPTAAAASTPLPPCLACGIKPPLAVVLKAAIAAAADHTPQPNPVASPAPISTSSNISNGHLDLESSTPSSTTQPKQRPSSIECPRCTFHNHPSLSECEMCGAAIASTETLRPNFSNLDPPRGESPGPAIGNLNLNSENSEVIKFSFRSGGDKIFHERLKGALIQRQWLLQSAPPVPKASGSPIPGNQITSTPDSPRPSGVGIAGLERRGLETRRNNEAVIGSAFEDLEALMASAKEIVALAETFAKDSGMGTGSSSSNEANTILSQSATALGMVTTKDMLGSSSETLYLTELSRNLAEWLADDRKGILAREGGVISLIDLWAMFNRSRNGVELISPLDFEKAAQLWVKLRLPVRLRRFRHSGLLVVQPAGWTDEKTIAQLTAWLNALRQETPDNEVNWDWDSFGRGVTAQETAQRFGWSVGVATEELEMAEERGILCREESVEGLKFWLNHMDFEGGEGSATGISA